MNIKNLIEAVKFQVSVKPQDEFMAEVAKGVEKLYEENNRQKAEIERLKGRLESSDKQLEAMKEGNAQLYLRFNTAHNKAVKEFAERLKERFESWSSYSGGLIFANIDNLVKEMVGEG